jgi:hypothetical protein
MPAAYGRLHALQRISITHSASQPQRRLIQRPIRLQLLLLLLLLLKTYAPNNNMNIRMNALVLALAATVTLTGAFVAPSKSISAFGVKPSFSTVVSEVGEAQGEVTAPAEEVERFAIYIRNLPYCKSLSLPCVALRGRRKVSLLGGPWNRRPLFCCAVQPSFL